AWYLIPTAAIASSRWAITFFPHIPNSRGRHEKYREAWYLLGAKRTNLASTRLRSTKGKPQRTQRSQRQKNYPVILSEPAAAGESKDPENLDSTIAASKHFHDEPSPSYSIRV